MLDPTISLAFSVHSSPGVYALLLGSGISRAAGIPTGWEVVLDLIRKLAALRGVDCEPDPEQWYETEFATAASYSALLESLAKSPAERQHLLRAYFEPSTQDEEAGIKLPTKGHRAIAELVKTGHIRVLLTLKNTPDELARYDRRLNRLLDRVFDEYAARKRSRCQSARCAPNPRTRVATAPSHAGRATLRLLFPPEHLAQELDHHP